MNQPENPKTTGSPASPGLNVDHDGIDRARSALGLALSQAQKTPAKLHMPAFVRVTALLEIALFLIVTLGIDWLLFSGHRFMEVEPHPFWIIVLLISVQYGTNAGMLAALACSAALLIGNIPPQTVDQDFYSYLYSLTVRPATWIGVALVLGELSNREREKSARLAHEVADISEQVRVIDAGYRQVLRAKESLEARVAGQLRTVVNLLQATQKLEQLGSREVIADMGDMVRAVLDPRKFSAYLLEGNALEVVLTEGWRTEDTFARRFDAGSSLFAAIVAERRSLVVANTADQRALAAQGIMASPLIVPESGEVIGMIKIEDMGFLDVNLGAIENLKVMCDWISTAFAKARNVEKMAEGSVYNKDSTLFSTGYLQRQTQFLLHLAERTNFDVCQLVLRVEGVESMPEERRPEVSATVGNAVATILRDTDMAFDHQRSGWEFAVLLPATTPEGAELVGRKLLADVEERLRAEHFDLRTIVNTRVLHRARRTEQNP